MAVARFVGIGVGEYDNGHLRLERAVPDVEAVAGLLEDSFECTVLNNPVEQAARDCLKGLRNSMLMGGGLLLLWSGHAVRSPADGLRLLARDSGSYDDDGLGAGSDVAAPCAQSGANQLLLIVDTCFSGEAVAAGDVAARIMQRSPPEGEHVWVGVLTSCLPEEMARDGMFGHRLAKLLAEGPEPGPDTRALLVQRWSPQNAYIRGDDLCDAVLKAWGTTAHTPVFRSSGSAWWMFRNPRYDPGTPERVVEHLLLAARGGAGPDEQSWFTGRTAEVDQVVGWVRSGQPGLHVITGSAGTGKTAIAGRVVSLSNPAERERLLAEGEVIGHADPGERSVAAHVHARGLTADRAADSIAGQLVRAGVLDAQPDRRNAAELIGQVQRAAEQRAATPVIMVDGLDEARGHAFAIAKDLLLRLSPYAVVIVSTRELRSSQTEPSLLDVLTAGTAELDLDDPAEQQRGRADMRAYIAGRLVGMDAWMDPEAIATHLAGETTMTSGSPFLLARLVTDQLRASPVDTFQPGWQEQVSHSVEAAFDADLAQISTPGRPEMAAARSPGESARQLLAALTWGLGAGLPEEEWLACANASADGELGRDDISWVLDELGRYIIQDGEARVAVYRIAHQSLADHIRPPFAATSQQIFDPQAQPVAVALLGLYTMLLANGIPATDSGYLRRYAWRHAAAAGPAGLELIRGLAAGEPQLLPDVAMADREVADRLASWGHLLEAVTSAEEAARLYRQLIETSPAFLPDLAGTLGDLGTRYSQVGRRQDALAPAEEAIRIYHALADTSPAFLPALATALNNLGNRYSQVGRWQDALAPAEEALRIRRELAAANRAFLPDLATALNNLGNRYSQVGRRQDALALAEEALRIRRALAAANPAFLPRLASTLNNLGNHYSNIGRRQDALASAEEALQLYQELAAANPAFLPNLASALSNLGVRYSEVSRWQDALAPTEEAVRIRRELAAANPAFLPDLAGTLSNLGTRYSGVGRWQDALAPAEEAVRLYQELADTSPASLPDLADALNNLGTRYSEMGRWQDALAPTEEAVRLYRELAAANPASLPNLADALNNLGVRYSEAGRWQDALAPAEEAVQLRRQLAAADPASLPNLADALNNLGASYSQVGRWQDALAPTGEAVQLRRELAATNRASLPDLASALRNLGNRFSKVGRWQDALAPAKEAVQLYRELDAADRASLPDLADALSDLGVSYCQVGRWQDALAPTGEAVRLYRELAAADPAFLPNLAGALNNLGASYSGVGRWQDALAPAEEAVRLYQELAGTSPTFLPDLASALNNLGNHYSKAGSADRREAVWEHAIAEAAPEAAAYLLVARAGVADASHSAAATWLARALAIDINDRDLVDAAHEQARRHRGPDQAAFDQNWTRLTGMPVPAWLTVDPPLLSSAQAWVATDTYTAQRDHLAAHPELLEATADTAVAEALLAMPEDEAGRYVALRHVAQQDGADAAYQPLLLTLLAHEFTGADPGHQRTLLADRRDDLLTDTVANTLRELAGQQGLQAAAAQRATVLLDLARSGDAEPVFEALTEPSRFPSLLHTLASRSDAESIGSAALVAYTAAATIAEAATAVFYLAVAMATGGDQEQAHDLIGQARAADPAQVPAWINELAELGQQHQGVLQLIPALIAPADQPSPPESSSEDTDDRAD